MSLDVFDLCTEELQQKLMPVRTKFKEIEDKKVEEAAVRLSESKLILRIQNSNIFSLFKIYLVVSVLGSRYQFSILISVQTLNATSENFVVHQD